MFNSNKPRRIKFVRYAWLAIRALFMANILSLAVLCVRFLQKPDDLVYSPAHDFVRYEVKRFNTGFLDNEPVTVFQGPPSDEVDAAWADLYEAGVSWLLPEEARRLKDPSIPAPGSKVYIGGLDVFHQLHCLDMIRMAAYPNHYNATHTHHTLTKRSGTMAHPDISDAEHLRHCINSVRQSLMCSSDVSVNIYYNPKQETKPFPRFDQMHTCRDFDSLRDWAFKRTTNIWHE